MITCTVHDFSHRCSHMMSTYEYKYMMFTYDVHIWFDFCKYHMSCSHVMFTCDFRVICTSSSQNMFTCVVHMWFTVCDVAMWFSVCDVHMWKYYVHMWCSHVMFRVKCIISYDFIVIITIYVHMCCAHVIFRMWCSHVIFCMWCSHVNTWCSHVMFTCVYFRQKRNIRKVSQGRTG